MARRNNIFRIFFGGSCSSLLLAALNVAHHSKPSWSGNQTLVQSPITTVARGSFPWWGPFNLMSSTFNTNRFSDDPADVTVELKRERGRVEGGGTRKENHGFRGGSRIGDEKIDAPGMSRCAAPRT